MAALKGRCDGDQAAPLAQRLLAQGDYSCSANKNTGDRQHSTARVLSKIRNESLRQVYAINQFSQR